MKKQQNSRDMTYGRIMHYMERIRFRYHPDSLEASGCFVGYRSIEWCQKKQKDYKNTKYPNWDGPSSYAFII